MSENAIDVLGWVVMTWNMDIGWQPDWDGRLHTVRSGAVGELRLAEEAGHRSALARVTMEEA